jgi:hypothetical protein
MVSEVFSAGAKSCQHAESPRSRAEISEFEMALRGEFPLRRKKAENFLMLHFQAAEGKRYFRSGSFVAGVTSIQFTEFESPCVT